MTYSISSHATPGTPDPIQIHARAVNSLRLALHYLTQADSNVPGAGRKAEQALAAIVALRNTGAVVSNEQVKA